MFIQTEETPNPATLKFLPGRVVLPEGTRDFRDPDEADVSPLASRIFAIDGVSGVFLGHDFVALRVLSSLPLPIIAGLIARALPFERS